MSEPQPMKTVMKSLLSLAFVCTLPFACAPEPISRESLLQDEAPHPKISVPAAQGSAFLRGELSVDDALAADAKKGDVIFLMARKADGSGTVAVARLVVGDSWPIPFELTQRNVMMRDGRLEGPLKLLARIDKDGEAMSKNPGDLVAELTAPVTVPSSELKLVFDRKL